MSPLERRRSPVERRERALTFLAQLYVRSSGYGLRGVYGWAGANEFEQLAGSYAWAALLAGLAGSGLVDEQAASVPGVNTRVRLYRITQAGMNEIALALRECAPTVTPLSPADSSDSLHAREWFGWEAEAPIYTEHDGGRLLVPPLRIILYGSGN